MSHINLEAVGLCTQHNKFDWKKLTLHRCFAAHAHPTTQTYVVVVLLILVCTRYHRPFSYFKAFIFSPRDGQVKALPMVLLPKASRHVVLGSTSTGQIISILRQKNGESLCEAFKTGVADHSVPKTELLLINVSSPLSEERQTFRPLSPSDHSRLNVGTNLAPGHAGGQTVWPPDPPPTAEWGISTCTRPRKGTVTNSHRI